MTSNHVHLLVEAEDRFEASGLMRNVAGDFSRTYNRRKARMNAFWGDNFHATLVEGGNYLWRCLCYVELNMVRAGVVRHPREWEWVGYHEIMGSRQRYRLLDLDRLCWRLGTADIEEVRGNLEAVLTEAISRGQLEREPSWTESLAVGSPGFLDEMKLLILSRREMEVVQTAAGLTVLQESPIPYGQERGLKSGASGQD